MFRGKKYQESAKLIDKSAQYEAAEGMDLICKTAKAKFDETVELHVKLGVDSRHADQQVRGAIVLPHGTGKTVRVLVFAKGDKAEAAKAAGADASLQVVPYYNKPTQEGLYRHFKTIAEAVDIPIILYNVPGRTVADLKNDTLLRLAQLPGIVGLKDATGDLARGIDLLRRLPHCVFL